jgi:uncharacterized protein
MGFPVTSLYAGISGIFLLILSGLVSRQRYKHQVAIGDGGADILNRFIRAQANFVEYVPFIMLIMALLEAANTSIYLLHVFGISLLIGRFCHAYSLTKTEPQSLARTGKQQVLLRQIGMLITYTVLGVASIALMLVGLAGFTV